MDETRTQQQPRGWTSEAWLEYQRRLRVREERRAALRARAGFSPVSGRGVPHRWRRPEGDPGRNARTSQPPSGGNDRGDQPWRWDGPS